MKRKVQIKFSNSKEEYFFLSDLMLFNDDLHEFNRLFQIECRELDQYKESVLQI